MFCFVCGIVGVGIRKDNKVKGKVRGTFTVVIGGSTRKVPRVSYVMLWLRITKIEYMFRTYLNEESRGDRGKIRFSGRKPTRWH